LGLDRISKLSLPSGKTAAAQQQPEQSTASFPYDDPRSSGGTEVREVALDPAGERPK
jgi:hypothetical protein